MKMPENLTAFLLPLSLSAFSICRRDSIAFHRVSVSVRTNWTVGVQLRGSTRRKSLKEKRWEDEEGTTEGEVLRGVWLCSCVDLYTYMYVHWDDTIVRIALIPQLRWDPIINALTRVSVCYRSDKRSRTILQIRRWTRWWVFPYLFVCTCKRDVRCISRYHSSAAAYNVVRRV